MIKPIAREERICFGIAWYATEEDAKAASLESARHNVYNGGWRDGEAYGRAPEFDREVDGKKQYAVTD